MKILMYGWEFPPYINGGLGIACYDIVQSLLKKNIEIELVLPKIKSQSTIAKPINESSKLHELGLNIQFIDSILKPYMNREHYNEQVDGVEQPNTYGHDLIAEVNRYAQQATTLLETMNPDLIYAHDWLTIRAGILAKKNRGIPLFFHVHSLEIDRSAHIDQRIFDIEYEGLHQADKIFAVSHYTRDEIIKHYQVCADKILVVHNGIPGSFYKNNHASFISSNESSVDHQLKKEKLVLFLGRITHQKGPFYFIDALNKILSVRQDIHFAIAGVGDLLHDLIEYVAKLNISSHVHFLGFLDRQQVRTIYESSQVYVMPSVSEPFGLTCLEALMSNVPLVISKQSGVSEVLHDVFKVDYWETKEMAEKIMALIDYPVLATEMIKNSQLALASLHWDNSVKPMIHAFNEFLGA